MDRRARTRAPLAALALLAVVSTAAKVLLAGAGHNFDLESWALFAEILREGKNIYAETYRNPYGPLWSYICAGVSYLQTEVLGSHGLEGFHRLIALFLSLADVAIAFLLARHYSLVAGCLFLLNPVSLLVTGFHSQFDNLVVLLAFVACLWLDENERRSKARSVLAMSLLGVSLVFKHTLIFLPLWFFFRPGSSRRERIVCLLPYGIFAMSFVPFIGDERGLEGVVEHVFLYDSFHLDAFFPKLLATAAPLKAIERLFSWVPVFSGFKTVWLAAMLMTGLAVRGRSNCEQLLVYLVSVVVFSSAMADQYLAIPLLTCAVYWRHLTTWWYVAFSALYLASSQANVGMLSSMASYAVSVRELGLERWHPVAALFVLLVIHLWHFWPKWRPTPPRS